MKTKHTFLFTFILGLVWTTLLFAYATGPDPGVNGVFGPSCNQAGCHVGNALNAAGGTLTLGGLPAQWTPGQTYLLTVTIQRASAVRYGFQLSAVFSAGNGQAGTFAVPAGQIRVSLLNGLGLQFAQHNALANTTGVFTVNWTAPASAAGGAVRFNLAGNAANGDSNNTGDFIYTRVDNVSPTAAPATPTLTGIATSPSPALANQAFSFTLTGTNFDGGAGVTFTGPGCGGGCAGNVTGRTPTSIEGTAQLAAGNFTVVVRNGDGTSSNQIALAVTVPPVTSAPFSLTNLQGASLTTDGSGALSVGYARIQPNAGSTTPSGVAIFGLRQNNVFVSEAGVPASRLLTAGRIYAEVSGVQGLAGAVNTGLAIANPNAAPATITFHFTDANGVDTASVNTPIPANGQMARFLDQDPFFGGSNIRGSFTFTSTLPVAVTALRGYYNERPGGSEFLITTLPVLDTSTAAPSATVFLPHFADGGGWTTQIVLVNPTDTTLTGSIQFFNQGSATVAAGPLTLTANTQVGSSFTYTVPRRTSFKLTTSGAPALTSVGSVRIVPSAATASPSTTLIFSFKSLGITVSEAGVPGVSGNAFRMYAEVSGSGNSPGTVQTGLAVSNLAATATSIVFDLYRLDGTLAGNRSVDLGGNGQTAAFLHELFPGLTFPFRGILRISGGAGAGMSVVGLRGRYNERPGNFLLTTTPATNEADAATAAERVFPHLVNGGGYTTQFILFSGTAGQVSAGNVRFFAQDGSALGVVLN